MALVVLRFAEPTEADPAESLLELVLGQDRKKIGPDHPWGNCIHPDSFMLTAALLERVSPVIADFEAA